MAIVICPALSMRASGDLGAINYTSLPGLQIARAKYTCVQPDTAKQLVCRARLTTLVGHWKSTLTQAQRLSWGQVAKRMKFPSRLGQFYQPSGYLCFMKYNMVLLQNGLTYNIAPPQFGQPRRTLTLSFKYYATYPGMVSQYTWSPVDGTKPDRTEVMLSPAKSLQADAYVATELRWMGCPTTAGGFGYTIPGQVLLGYWYWFKYRTILLTGEGSNWTVSQFYVG